MFRSAWGLLNAMGYSFHSTFPSRACGQNGTFLLLLTYQYLIDRRQPGVSGVLTMPHLPYKITTHFKYHYEKPKDICWFFAAFTEILRNLACKSPKNNVDVGLAFEYYRQVVRKNSAVFVRHQLASIPIPVR